jgi:hypothetical protein
LNCEARFAVIPVDDDLIGYLIARNPNFIEACPVMRLTLNFESWQTQDDFYEALFNVLGAPSWHGCNFNALRDSIGVGNINSVEPPYRFIISGTPAGAEASQCLADFSPPLAAPWACPRPLPLRTGGLSDASRS